MALTIRPKRWSHQPPVSTQLNYGHPLSTGLVAGYLFNAASGIITKDIVSFNHGVQTNGPTWSASPYGGALTFSAGGSTYVSLADTPPLTIASPITMVMWVNTTDTTSVVVGGYNTSPYQGYGFGFGQVTSGKPCYWSGAQLAWVEATSTANDGKWHQLAVAVSGAGSANDGSASFYKDGLADGTATTTTPNSAAGINRQIGAAFGGSGFFTGSLAQLLIYNRKLTPSEIQWLYTEPFAMMTPQAPTPRLWAKAAAVVTPTRKSLALLGVN